MIVLKHNGIVYIAKSCWTLRDLEAYKTCVPDTDNLCIWHPNRRKNRLIATNSGGRFVDAIRYESIFPSVLDKKNLFHKSYGMMCAIADRFGMYDGNKLPKYTFFAEGDRAFVISPDGAIMEIEDIFIQSSNDNGVIGAYDYFDKDDPYEFLKRVFASLEIIEKYVMFPVVVMNTGDNKIKVIESKEGVWEL